MKIRESENILFEKWKIKRPNLIPDGIVNPDIYANNHTKVLYILKEVNGGENWDLRDFLRNGAHWRTWNNIVRWQFGIETENSTKYFDKINYVNNDIRKKYLNRISIINLKKEAGGSNSKMAEIWDYSWKDREYIKAQIELYKPDVIICCGTGNIVKEHKLITGIKEWKSTTNGVKYFTNDNTPVIDYVHPQQYRINKKKLFIDLISAYNEIKENLI